MNRAALERLRGEWKRYEAPLGTGTMGASFLALLDALLEPEAADLVPQRVIGGIPGLLGEVSQAGESVYDGIARSQWRPADVTGTRWGPLFAHEGCNCTDCRALANWSA